MVRHCQVLISLDFGISTEKQLSLAGVSKEKIFKTLRLSHTLLLGPCKYLMWGGNPVTERAAGMEETSGGQKQNWIDDTGVFMFHCPSLVSNIERNPRLLPKDESNQTEEACTRVPDYILMRERGKNYARE